MKYEEQAVLKENIPKAVIPCEACGEPVSFSNHPVVGTWIRNLEIVQDREDESFKFKLKNNETNEMPICFHCYQLFLHFLAQGKELRRYLEIFLKARSTHDEILRFIPAHRTILPRE